MKKAFFFLYLISTIEVSAQCVSDTLLIEGLEKKPPEITLSQYKVGCNVTNRVKNKLTELLNPNWKESEIIALVNKQMEERIEFYDIKSKAKIASNGIDSAYKKSYDSLIAVYKMGLTIDLKNSSTFNKVDDNVIKAIAWIYHKEAIPILKKALKENSNKFNTSVLELALARLGDKKLQEKYFRMSKPAPSMDKYFYTYKNLHFINTQESIYKLNSWLDTSIVYEFNSSGDTRKVAGLVVASLKQIILNEDFVKVIKNVKFTQEVSSEIILFCRKWLIKNKGRYKLG